MPLIGAHVSAAGGLHRAIQNGTDLGVEAIQIFGASPRQWIAKQPGDKEVRAFLEARNKSKIKRVYLHAAYLVNLATPNEALLKKSVKSLTEHLAIARAIEADGLIFHVGSSQDMPQSMAIKQVIVSMKEVLKSIPGDTQLIMENSAGGGRKVGSDGDFEEIFAGVDSRRVKVCLDTAHAFEAGLIEHYTPDNVKALVDLFDKAVGAENIVALHANDSKTPFNSRHDRHENLGEGHIGLQAFINLAKEKRIRNTSWILEVPGFDDMGPDKRNVELLRSCLKAK